MDENYTPPIWRLAKEIGDFLGWEPPVIDIPKQKETDEQQ